MIRAATPDDVGALAGIHADAVALAYGGIFDASEPPPSPDQLVGRWAVLLATPQAWIDVLERDGAPAGMIGVRPSPDADADPSIADLFGFHVHPSYWGQGHGRRLLARATSEAAALAFTEISLWVLEANVRARRLYVAAGWLPDGASRPVGTGVRDLRYRRTPLA
jgi:ribosomal protein S18 acetylase RimI-like enzyme